MKKISILIIGLVLGLTAGFFLFSGSGQDFTTLQTAFASEYERLSKVYPVADEQKDGTYNFDKAHSFIGFKIRHQGLADIYGNFNDFKGMIQYNEKDVTKSSVEFTAQAKSINTNNAGRDRHLQSADFFEVEKYPEVVFKSTKVEKKGKKGFVVYGDFTMKGVTKQIMIPFQIAGMINDPRGGVKMGVIANTTINRRDYGINYGQNMPNGIPAIADNVDIILSFEVIKPTTPKAE